MDLAAQLFGIAFLTVLCVITGLCGITYYSFFRMNVQIRRARMFIMSNRIQRFLLAFLLAFLALVATYVPAFSGVGLPPAVGTFAVFFFLGAITYGILELYFVAVPTSRLNFRSRKQRPTVETPAGGTDEGK